MKKIVTVFLIIGILGSSFSSCENHTVSEIPTKLTGVFTKEEIPLDKNFTPNGSLTAEENLMYLIGNTMTDEVNKSSVAVLNMEDMTVSYDILPDGTYESLAVSNGNYLLSSSSFDERTFQNIYTIHSIMDDGVLWEKSVNDIITLPDYYWGSIYLASLENNWYVGGGTSLSKLSQDGIVYQIENLPSDITGLEKDSDGLLHIWGNDYHKIVDSNGNLSDAPNWIMANVSELFFGGGHDYYYKNENGLIGYAIDTSESTEILNWVNSGLVSSGIRDMVIISPEMLVIYGNDGVGGKTGLWKYTKTPDVELTDKQIVRVLYTEDGQNKLPIAAVKFNSSQSKYHIVCEEFASISSTPMTIDSLDKSIIDGSIGDIIVVSDLDSLRKYGEKGLLSDLYTLMSEEVSPDNIFKCVRKACEVDGKLWGLPQEFTLDTCATTNKLINMWNVETFISLSNNLSDDQQILNAMSQSDVHNVLRDSIISECIDLENNTCSFDSGIFISYLDFLATLSKDQTEQLDQNTNNYICDKVVLYHSDINSYASYYQMMSVFGEDKEVEIVGYPSFSGGAAKFNSYAFYSILESSGVKEGAMAFIQYLLSADCVIDEMRGMRFIPTLKTTAKAWDDSESKMYYYFYYDNIGRWSGDTNLITEDEANASGVCIQMTQERIEKVYDFLDNVNVFTYIPTKIIEIVEEEMSTYFNSHKTSKETAQIIQNRVNIYLSEKE